MGGFAADDETDDGDERTYSVSVEALFVADGPEDAVRQMVEYLQENAHTLDYQVGRDGWVSAVEVDASALDRLTES